MPLNIGNLLETILIRDFLGNLLAVRSIMLVGVIVPMAEIFRAWPGLRCAIIVCGAKKIWLEGESLKVVQWINSRRGNGGYSDALVHDISVWIKLIEKFRCSHVMQEGNMVARIMASIDSKEKYTEYSRNFMPEKLREIFV